MQSLDTMTHGIRHRMPPKQWQDGFPLGNGCVGAMCWGDGAPLAFTLDHADLWDLCINTSFQEQPDYTYADLRRLVGEGRYEEAKEIFELRELRDNPVGPTKISIGRAELTLGSAVTYDVALDLATATVQGILQTADGVYPLRAFVHRTRNLLCLRIDGLPASAELRLLPLAQISEGLAQLGHPAPTWQERDSLRVMAQEIPGGLCYAVVWNVCGPDILLAIETGADPADAATRAEATWQAAHALGMPALHAEHCAAWADFWAVSAVSLPEPEHEFLWHYGIYLLASSARRGHAPPGLQGLWAMDGVLPPWRGDYHADMNVQETFWPACATGHLELLDSWCDLMAAELPRARDFTRRFFGTEGAFRLCCTLPAYTSVYCWYTMQFAWSHSGWLAWLVWQRWRYSMDRAWLAEIGYPIVSEIVRFYRANLEADADGILHVPLSSSPEYWSDEPAAWARDPNCDLALIRRCCAWVIEMEEALGIDDLRSSAAVMREQIAPYARTEHGVLCLWPDHPLDRSHRHPSHLMAIHPAMDITVEDGDDARALIEASLLQYCSLGQWEWAGHSYAQLISMAAVTGRAGFAYECLRQFAEHWIGPNALHVNADLLDCGMSVFRRASYAQWGSQPPFTMESNCAVNAGICDMLVQGWNDLLRIFPAVPQHWRDVAFRDLHTEGAFRVSAIRRDGETAWVRIVAGVTRQLRVRDPFAGQAFESEGHSLRRDGDCIIADLAAGEEVVLYRGEREIDWQEVQQQVRMSDCGRIGLR